MSVTIDADQGCFQVSLTETGQQVRSVSLMVSRVHLQAAAANSSTVQVGTSASNCYLEIPEGDTVPMSRVDLSQLYVKQLSGTGDKLTVFWQK